MDKNLEVILANKLYLKVDGRTVYFKSPNIDLKYRSSIFYERTIQSSNYEDWLTKESIPSALISRSIIEANTRANLGEMDKSIEEEKVALFKAAHSPKEIKRIKKQLVLLRDKHTELINRLHCLDYITVEGYAELLKSQFIIRHSIFYKRRKFLKKDTPYYIYEQIVGQLNELRPNYTEIRQIAKGEDWGAIWRASKGRPFKGSPFNWTDEQKHLVLLSQMYDNIYKNPECPKDNVIQDDDMLDGWLILQRRKINKEKEEKGLKELIPGFKDGNGENFVFVDNVNELLGSEIKPEDINQFNDAQGNMIKNQRQGVINNSGEDGVTQSQFLDVKLENRIATNQAFLKAGKGN